MEKIVLYLNQAYGLDRGQIAKEAGFKTKESLSTTISAGGNPKALKKLELLRDRLDAGETLKKDRENTHILKNTAEKFNSEAESRL